MTTPVMHNGFGLYEDMHQILPTEALNKGQDRQGTVSAHRTTCEAVRFAGFDRSRLEMCMWSVAFEAGV